MQTGLSSHAMRHCKLKPGYFDFRHAKRHHTQKKYFCTLTRVSPVVLTSTVLASTNAVSRFSSVLDTSQIKSRAHHQPSMLCPPSSCFPTIKGEIQTENYPYPRIPLASFPKIEGSQQCYSTGCGGVVVAAAVVAVTAAAAVVVTAATVADDVVTAVAAVVVVADRQWKRLRCHVRWCRSSRRLTRTDCPPKWCSRGNSTAGRRCRLRCSVR